MKELEKTQDKSTKALKEHEEKIDEFIKTFLVHENLKDHEITKFRQVAIELGLDPFNKELYVVAYPSSKKIDGEWVAYRELSLITGYEVYLRRADFHPDYEGYEVQYNGKLGDPDFSCTITVYRKNRKYPTVHTVYFNEFAGKKKDGSLNKFWFQMPRFMIFKVGIGQSFRLAFPNDFAKMPYVKEEIDNNIRDVTPEKTEEAPAMIETDKLVDELKNMKTELLSSGKLEQKVKEANEKKTKKTEAPTLETPVKKEVVFNSAEAMDEIITRARNIKNFLSKEQIEHYQQLMISKDYTQKDHKSEENFLEVLIRASKIESFLSDDQKKHYNNLLFENFSHDEELQFLTQLEADGKDFSQEVNK